MARNKISLALMNLGGVLMLLGGALDLSMRHPPDAWGQVLGEPVTGLALPMVRLLLALVHALGGSLLAGAGAVLLLVNGPVRRGDRAAALAVGVIAALGEGGNGLQMVWVGLNYGWWTSVFIAPVLLGLAVAYVPSSAFVTRTPPVPPAAS